MQNNFPKRSNDNPKIKTLTTNAVRDYTREFLSPAEMLPGELAELLDSDITDGMKKAKINAAKSKYGPNIIKPEFETTLAQSLKKQVLNIQSVLLILCALLMFIFKEELVYLFLSAIVAAVMVINAVIEQWSSSTMRSVIKASSPKAAVIRNGKHYSIDRRNLVIGDIILLDSGSIVPADARLIETNNLLVIETLLTKNEYKVQKNANYIATDTNKPFHDNMVYANTIIASGSGRAIVTATGVRSVVRVLQKETPVDPTPALLRYIKKAGRAVSMTAVCICFLLVMIGLAAGIDIVDVFMLSLTTGAISLSDTAIALAAAAMASGMKAAEKNGAVIKNMNSIAKLCAVDTIMCDRANAIPPKNLTAESIFMNNDVYPITRQNRIVVERLMKYFLVCSNFKEKYSKKSLKDNKKDVKYLYDGNRFDLALLRKCREIGLDISNLTNEFLKIENEYNSSGDITRCLVLNNGLNTVIVKGAPETVITRCAGYEKDGQNHKMTDNDVKKFLEEANKLSNNSLIVYAIAAGVSDADTLKNAMCEKKLIFKGFIGFYSSVYVDLASAVYKTFASDVDIVVRSDESYYHTLSAVKNAGIINDESQMITSEQMKSMNQGLFIADCDKYRVFNQITDAQWQYVLNLKKEAGHTVAVTADKLEDLFLISAADVTFVPDSGAPEILTQSSSVLFDSGGINVFVKTLEFARLIYKRVFSVFQYLLISFCTFFFAAFFSMLFGLDIPYRISEMLFAGIIINLFFALSLAFCPPHRKILSERMMIYKTKFSVTDLFIPIIYSFIGAMSLIITNGIGKNFGAATANSMSVITLSFIFFAFALSGAGGMSLLSGRSQKNILLIFAFAGQMIIIGGLLVYSPAAETFGYGLPSIPHIFVSIASAAVSFLVLQLILFIKEQKNYKLKGNAKKW